jgi:MFS family permease
LTVWSQRRSLTALARGPQGRAGTHSRRKTLNMLVLLRTDANFRRFITACVQSQLGTGAAFVALLIVAYHRTHTGWAVSAILLSNLVPAVVGAPYFGALADRMSRRRLAVVGDLVGAAAFAGLALVPSFAAMVPLAVAAGAGAALSRCAIKAALPTLVAPERRSAATALWGVCRDAGMTLGPSIAAVLLLVGSPELVLVANAGTFAASALLLRGVDLGQPSGSASRRGHPTQVREVISALCGLPDLAIVIIAGSVVALAGGLINVAEPLLAIGPLEAGGAGYAVLVAAYGLGMVAGGCANARCRDDLPALRRRWLVGMAVTGLGLCATGAAPTLAVATASFAVTGVGNILVVGSEIRLLQERSPEALVGRLFGLYDAVYNGALASALLIAGAVLTLGGPRTIFLLAGAGVLCILACASVCLRSTGDPLALPEPARP